MTLHIQVLPPAQATFWREAATRVPSHFAFYGGTAIALQLGHRVSVDFHFFSDRALDRAALRAALPELDAAAVLQAGADTLVVAAGTGAAAMALFGSALNPLDTAKAVGWFKDGDLESALPDASRRYLAAAAAASDPAVAPMPIRSRSLAG